MTLRFAPAKATARLEAAEQRLFARYRLAPRTARIALKDPALEVRVLELGTG